ncbi:glutamate synthase subunit alpha [filamentous cyanobacterium LEGE 11480]|uniref:glutamate synthase (ferredoxin) n=1 Tax=Romeriopsis navalis LEGE 11480 TaxID=2777977 RepID=A0A928Z2T0_9CYAN|nr:glutamate synthase-related protein [Romeriopsis navalis]MBE9029372.1 glutamate synthase subunit alpha [Romeriopsis navalis LEGE 11480]
MPKTNTHQGYPLSSENNGYVGQRWLVEERDACGVGFVVDQQGRASHDLVRKSLVALGCMEHRGGCSADYDSGDGAGVMTMIPWEIIANWAKGLGRSLVEHSTAVGMVFLPQGDLAAAKERKITETILQSEGFTVLGWRVVPIKPEILGVQAKGFLPQIEQVIVTASQSGEALEQQLYVARKKIEQAVESPDFYFCSFSSRTIVYKGMVRSEVLGDFYLDFKNPSYKSVFSVYHRRFSTNTMPKWPLAQPMRYLGHNGEINTLLGNINWMVARQSDLQSAKLGADVEQIKPIVNAKNSDSANLDNVLELLVQAGRSPMESLMILVPEAYKNQPDLLKYPEIVDFYEYYRGIQEPWDGPALLVFSDGKKVGATLDRNGLRPARYAVTKDGYIVVASEAGVVPLPESEIVEKGRLGPGQMIAFDLETQQLYKNWDLKQKIASEQPYGEWLRQHRQSLKEGDFQEQGLYEGQALLQHQSAFGYTSEDVEMIINEMAAQGKEPTFCMGDDAPLAVLSQRPHLLYDYFKQRFAQVTNPPIDPLREKLVMSLNMSLGARGNVLEATPELAKTLTIESPVLTEAELNSVKAGVIPSAAISTLYNVAAGPAGLATAVKALCGKAAEQVNAGNQILILSDRVDATGNPVALTPEQSYIPPLVAVGAVHHHLIRQGLRMHASIVADTAQAWSTHHFACLVGYGASAVCPYLALDTVRNWWAMPRTQKMMETGKIPAISLVGAQENFRKSIQNGLLKILSKMGISLLASYHGAQIFEAIGIGGDLLETAFNGTASRMGGLTLQELAQETMSFHTRAFPELSSKKLANMGFVQYRPGGEYHMNSPEMAKYLHKAVEQNSYDHYESYQKYQEDRPPTALRDLLEFESDRPSIELSEVESATEIVKRFATGGMSLGALSREAHEVLAIAMNRMGAKSNSGEGGEDVVRFKTFDNVADGVSPDLPHLKGLRNGDTANSAIKQIASGRFGVTPEYLMNGKQLEIKMAQGAKPGEGGQLPGPKVSSYIAMLRRSKPGVTLISPPPHHDIYSIEDLAQLIYDLHQINPVAKVSVKLVSEVGIGTIAAGVAKANADIIQISGHDGGTGASPLSSIKHAGSPWELGLTEVHRTLMENQLRNRVLLRVDGGIKTGWDVLMAALMGGEEFGFGSIAMIAEGCIMARICHTNSCPVGVASQREELRKRFTGIPEHVVNFFLFVAEEVRTILAKLGYRSLNEVIGRADLLKVRAGATLTKTASFNLDCLTNLPDTKTDRTWLNHGEAHSNGFVLDDEILADDALRSAIANQSDITITHKVVNTDRSVGARVSGTIAKQYGNGGFGAQINLDFTGSVGQSFGAFNLPCMTMTLTGEANDYVGKGIHGGEIIIKPSPDATFDPSNSSILGNTCLYGATGGYLYANGRAGERFAVRNSAAQAVVEGAGDHCCEYMTGGVVVVLGGVGRNVGAGMTGGVAYFLDEDGSFQAKVNPEIVSVQRVLSPAGEQQLKELLQAHAEKTGSAKSAAILANWTTYLPQFWQVVPPSEKDSPQANPDGAKVPSQV